MGSNSVHRILAGKNGKHMWNFLIRQQIGIGWKVGEGDFRNYSPEQIREMNPSGDNRQFVVKFLGYHENDEQNVKVGDEVIVYAPNKKIIVGVYDVVSEPKYDPHPSLVHPGESDVHYYFRDIEQKEWSRPVKLGEFQEHYNGDVSVYSRPTLQPFKGDLNKVRQAFEDTPRADLSEENLKAIHH